MNLKCLTIFFFLLINPYFNNIGYCQNDKTDIELENINGPGKPKAIVFRFDTITREFNGITFIKKNNIGSNAITLNQERNILKGEAIARRIKRLGHLKKDIGSGLISPNGKYYISVYAPDGDVQTLHFFNSRGILLNKFKINKPFTVSYDFNSFGTYFMLWGLASGEFYFFTSTGKLVTKGDYNILTGDPGTSYWRNEISKSGKCWALINNSTFIYDEKNNLIDKIPSLIFAIIYENLNYILYIKGKTIYIYNYQTHLIEYISSNIDCSNLNISDGNLYILLNDKKRLEYKITL